MLHSCGKDKPLTFPSVCIALYRAELADIQSTVKPSISRKARAGFDVLTHLFGDVLEFIVFTLSDTILQTLGANF